MNVSATFPDDPGFEKLWKYTITLSWDVGGTGGLEFLEVLLPWPTRLTVNHGERPILASGSAGRSDGDNPNCPAVYIAEFRRDLERGPTVRFQPEIGIAAIKGSGTCCDVHAGQAKGPAGVMTNRRGL